MRYEQRFKYRSRTLSKKIFESEIMSLSELLERFKEMQLKPFNKVLSSFEKEYPIHIQEDYQKIMRED